MNKTNLSPCPFCGGTARRSKGGTGENTYFGVGCDSTQQCPAYLYGLPHRTQEQADAAWNKREASITKSTDGEREALIHELQSTNLYYQHGKAIGLAKRAADMLAADAQPKPVFVRESDLDLDDLNKVLIDYRDQIARLRARIAVLDPVFSDAEGYQLSVTSPQLLTDEQICEIANRDFPKSDWPLYFARDIEAAIINKGGAA